MILYLISVFIGIPVSLFVLLKNPKDPLNRSYFIFTVLTLLWLTGLFLDQTPEDLVETHFKLLFVFSIYMASYLYYFSTALSNGKIRYVEKIVIHSISGFLSIITLLTDLLLIQIIKTDTSQVDPQRGLLYPVVVAWMIVLIARALYMLFSQVRKSKSDKKQQILVVFFGWTIASIFAITTNIILPNINNNINSNSYAPIASIVLTLSLALSILKYRFLDIKSIVVRSVAYVLSILVLLLLYLLASSYVFTTIFPSSQISSNEIIILSVLVLLSAVSFQPIKIFFDRLTNSIFFRHAYDSQTQLNMLSNVVVNEYELDKLVNRSIGVLRETVRPSKIMFILVEKKLDYFDSFGYGFDSENPEAILELISDIDDPLFHAGTFNPESMHIDSEKSEKLNSMDVVLTVRLSVNEQTVGYIVLGPKLSGNQYSSQDERFLEIAANELSIAIQNSLRYDEIKRFNETLRLEVDRATAELRESNRKLKELDEAKDEFVTMASHQLRTPLTSVKGYISMVMEGDAGKITKRQEELLTNAFTSSQRMVYLIADLLNVSRLRTGKFMIDAREVNLKDIIESEIDQLKETAKSRGLTLKFNAPKSFPSTMLDEEKIRQVIMNFVDNAIYYTPSKGKIEVSLESTDKEIKMTVKDNGIGVPKQDRPNLFTKFYRAGNARKARPDGTGLGLFMAKKVVVAQGGAIIFDSKEGQGSTFGFTFPLSRVGIKDKKPAKKKKSKKSVAKQKK